jgi:tripartite ATP-independent transporter DctM subunit
VVTRQSITALFAATIGPAILLMIGLIIFNRFCAGRLFNEESVNVPNQEAEPKSGKKIVLSALPALCMPFVILGGIYGGITTPTEAAAIAVVMAIFIGKFIYKDLNFDRLKKSVVAAGETSGVIILILLFSFMIGRILTAQRVPQEITESIMMLSNNPILILIVVNLFLIVAGAIMDDLTVTVVIAPLFIPLMIAIGVDPVHYASIVACSVVIGANSPPVAPILYLACRIGKVSIHKALMPAIYMLFFVCTPVMLVTTFVPELSLYIPRILGLL